MCRIEYIVTINFETLKLVFSIIEMNLIFPLSSILLGFTWHYNHCFNDEKSGEKEKVKEKQMVKLKQDVMNK